MHRLSPLRPSIILMPLGLLYAVIFGRMVQLHSADRSTILEDRFESRTPLRAARAQILDASGIVLAEDRPVWYLRLDEPANDRRFFGPSATLERNAKEIALLASLTHIPALRLQETLLNPKKTYARFAVNLNSTEVDRLRLALRSLSGTGLRLERSWERVYPQGRALSHLIGFLKTEEGSRSGVMGLERSLESQLLGSDGERGSLRVTGKYGANPAKTFVSPNEASPIVTTLDARLASMMQEELRQLQEVHNPDWIACVVVEVNTGNLIAVGGLPDFDPNHPGDGLKRDADGNLLGHALPALWAIEPGSTCKPFVVGRALDTGAVKKTDTFSNYGGSWNIRKPPIRNARGVPNERMTPREILVWSSNICAGQVGLKLGKEGLQSLFADFGFWDELGWIGPEPFLGFQPKGNQWDGSLGRVWTIPSVSMGHQLSLTPLRLACAFSSLINGGWRIDPHLIQQKRNQPKVRILSEDTSAFLRDALAGMVEAEHRHWLPKFEGFRWGGKSGTVQKTHEEGYTSLFSAFGPLENPEVLVLVVAENPKGKEVYGSKVSAPAAARILYHAIQLRDLKNGPLELDSSPVRVEKP